MDPVAEYRVLDVSSKRGRPKLYYNLQLCLLYASERSVIKEKYEDTADLLPCFPSIHHEHFKVLKLFETKNVVIEADND